MAQQKVVIQIPKDYKPAEREAIARDIIDYIVERTQKKNLDKDNVKFAGYSKSYKESLDFKIAGKSKNRVDLTLSGDMLSSIKTLNTRSGSVTIGFDAGDENNGKAEGNIKGTYGNRRPVGPRRDFLGLTNGDLTSKVLKNFPLDNREKLSERVLAVLAAEEQAEGVGNE
jgi:hypothetical protein